MIKSTSILLNCSLILILQCLSLYGQLRTQRPSSHVPSEVEIMYQKGVQYLLNTQTSEGNWDDTMGQQPGVVAFCLLSILASDHPPSKKVQDSLNKCLQYILKYQDSSSGYIGNSMYNHGFCTLALAETYGHVDYPNLGSALLNAVKLILSSQDFNPTHAWRYTPESLDADTSVTGCQIIALLAARNAGIHVPEEALEKALSYLESCRTPEGSYGYSEPYNGKVTLTAISLLSDHLYHSAPPENTSETLSYLKNKLNYRDQHYPFYYEYYMSQALFQADLETWESWNRKNIRYLKILQGPDGSWDGNLGKAYCTSAALLSLALNYRYMPIYERF